MHRTWKQETTRPPAHTLGTQQERLDTFPTCFHEQRPHEALGMQTPASVHLPSARPYCEVQPYDDSRFDDVRVVRSNGAIRFLRSTNGITAAIAGHEVGLFELDDDVWLVRFFGQDLGMFGVGESAISPLQSQHREAAPHAGAACLPQWIRWNACARFPVTPMFPVAQDRPCRPARLSAGEPVSGSPCRPSRVP